MNSWRAKISRAGRGSTEGYVAKPYNEERGQQWQSRVYALVVTYEGKGDCREHSEGGGEELHFSVVDWFKRHR